MIVNFRVGPGVRRLALSRLGREISAGKKWDTVEKRANNFRPASTAIALDPGAEANITPRMLVKCRAPASVTAAVGNKIAALQTGTLHTRYYDAGVSRVFISGS